MPIDWAHDYGFDGWMGYRDAAAEKSYIMGAEDGALQAVLNEDGTIQAAGGNIVLGANGLGVHDLSNASIITPAFGVGWIHDTIPSSEDFTAWTAGGTASVTGDTQQAPSGESATADTVALPADGDYVTKQAAASPELLDGQSAAFMVYLKAASAGTIRIQVGTSSGGDEIGTLDFSVETEWRRAVLIVTNGTGGDIRPYVTIIRSGAGQLASVYAWGAQMAYNVSKEVPYYFWNPGGDKKWGVAIRSPLFISHETTGSVLIGNNWVTLPTNLYSVIIGSGAGNGASDYSCVFIGKSSGDSSSAGNVNAIGADSAKNNTGTSLVALGNSAGGYSSSGNSGDHVIAIGEQAGVDNSHDYVMLLGRGASATNTYQIVFGSTSLPYTSAYMGAGVVHATPPDFAINATGGSGTNIAGGALTLAGGKGTGTGAGGSLLFKTAAAGASGTTLNSLTTRFEITGAGTLDFKNSPVVNFSGGGSGSVNRWRLMFGA